MVRTKWGQYTHDNLENGLPCFNYYTPERRRCGCVVTAMAQVLRYFRYPEGRYRWTDMPLNTLVGISDAQQQAIGRLSADLAESFEAEYLEDVTYVYASKAREALVSSFAFAQVEYQTYPEGCSTDALKDIVIPNCDYGLPVVLTIDDMYKNRHAVVVDGYGYSNGVFCVHASCGDYGMSDGWFIPPKFDIGAYKYDLIAEVLYNILPTERGGIVCGVVHNPDGSPAVGADLVLTDGRGVESSTRSNGSGVYAFLVENAGPCRIIAKRGLNAAEISVVCPERGNLRGNVIDLVRPSDSEPGPAYYDESVVSPPVVTPPGGMFGESVTVSLSTETEGALIRYTVDNSSPTETSPQYTGPFQVSRLCVVRAKAWKDGLEESDEVAVVFTPHVETVAQPTVRVVDGDGREVVPDASGAYPVDGWVRVSLLSATPDATIRYTEDGADPTSLSACYRGAFDIADSTTLKVCAWKDGWYTSDMSTFRFVYSSSATGPAGDDFNRPMVIRGREGRRVVAEIARYTLEPMEAKGNAPYSHPAGEFVNFYHDLTGTYWYQYHTAWLEWTAPAEGRIDLSIRCPGKNQDWPFIVVVYRLEGEEHPVADHCVASSYRDTDSADNNFYFWAIQGGTYRIGLVQVNDLLNKYGDHAACYDLSWDMDDEESVSTDDGLIDITGAHVVLSNYMCAYTGRARLPSIANVVNQGNVLRPDVDYTVAYIDNVNVGTGMVVVSGCGEYKGLAFTQFSVSRRRLTADMVEAIPDQLHTSYPICPPVTVRLDAVTLKPGVDYDLSYSNNVDSGTAYAVLIGQGNMRGRLAVPFNIVNGVVAAVGSALQPTALDALGVDANLADAKSVKAEGLPKGLKLSKLKADPWYVIGGTPQEGLDGVCQVAYVRITDKNKIQTLWPLSLRVLSEGYSASGELPVELDTSSLAQDARRKVAIAPQGVSVSCPLKGVSPPAKVKATGLPTGLKLKQEANAYVVTGVPTSVGEYVATFAVDDGSRSSSATAAFRVVVLPSWAQGTFCGSLGTNGTMTATVAAKGKVSVKASQGGLNWKCSMAGYSSVTNGAAFALEGNLVAGGSSLPFAAQTKSFVVTTAVGPVTNAVLSGMTTEGGKIRAYHDIWAEKRLLPLLAEVAGTYTHVTMYDERLSLTVDGKGKVKTTGRLRDGRKVSCSSPLALNEEGEWLALVYVAADARRRLDGVLRWLTLIPQHQDLIDYGDRAYRDGAVTAEMSGDGSGTVSYSPKYGQAAAGKPVSLTAKAARGSVFVKWQVKEGNVWRDAGYAAKLKLTATGADMKVRALFREVAKTVAPVIVFDAEAFSALRVGVAFDSAVRVQNSPDDEDDDLVRPVKFSAKGLPAGLKLDATSGRVYGVPTKASAVPFEVTVTSTADKSLTAKTTVASGVAALPGWAQGTFFGSIGDGTLTATVSAKGSVSVKAVREGANWKGSAPGYSAEEEGPTFLVKGELKSGKSILSFAVQATNWVSETSAGPVTNAILTGTTGSGDIICAYRNVWAEKRLTPLLADFVGTHAHATEQGDQLTLTVDRTGKVKAAGWLAGRKVSCSSSLAVAETGDLLAVVYVAPNAKQRQDGILRWLTLVPREGGGVIVTNLPGTY